MDTPSEESVRVPNISRMLNSVPSFYLLIFGMQQSNIYKNVRVMQYVRGRNGVQTTDQQGTDQRATHHLDIS